MRVQAREALAERLSRMTRPILKEKLRDQSDEVRRAAALACAMKEEKALIPDLIDLLADPKPRVGRAARASLMALSHEDFGPTDSAAKDRVTKAAELWRQWWVKNRDVPASSGSSR
jgi:HEAT repeat protein